MAEHDDPVVERFKGIATGLVTDAFLRLGVSGWMDDVFPIAPEAHIAGRARTLQWGPIRRERRLEASMYSLISRTQPGEVLVMGAGGTHDNLMGDNQGTFAYLLGLAGVVTDSRTRDREGMRALGEKGFWMFSGGAAVRPPTEVEMVGFDVEIICGRAQVRPRDIIVGDADGVVVIPAARAEDVLYQIEEISGIEHDLGELIESSGRVEDIEKLTAKKKIVRA